MKLSLDLWCLVREHPKTGAEYLSFRRLYDDQDEAHQAAADADPKFPVVRLARVRLEEIEP
jgi:hypothetical protein